MTLTNIEIDTLAEKHLHTLADKPYFALFDYARAIEIKVRAKLIEEIKAQGPSAFEYCGEPWFDGNNWHEQKEVTKEEKVAEFKAYLSKPPIPLYKLPEGD